LFLTGNKIVKIGDFGVSKVLMNNKRIVPSSSAGTPAYMAPEQIQAYDLKADIWQVGCSIYHLACLETPFQGETFGELTNAIVNRKPKPIPHVYSVRLRTFIESFLQKKP
jgi:serine/threonine protein kinase